MASSIFTPFLSPICPILLLADDWVYANFRSANFVRFLKWTYLASARSGYLSIDEIRAICIANCWVFETEKKAVYWAAKKGFCTKEETSGYYHFKSLYLLFQEFIDSPEGRRQAAYRGFAVTRIPVHVLFSLTPAEFRAYYLGKFVKKFKAMQMAHKAILARHEQSLKTHGYYVREWTDPETGERRKMRLGKEDLKFEKQRLGETWAPDIQAYETFVKSNNSDGEIDPVVQSNLDQYKENLRLPYRQAQVGGVNMYGSSSAITYGNFYTEVLSESPIKVENVVMHPAVIVGQMERHSHEGSNHRIYIGKPDQAKDIQGLEHGARIYKAHISLSAFSKVCGMSVGTVFNYSKKGFAGTVSSKTTEVVTGLYDPLFMAWFNNQEYGMNRSGVPHDVWGFAVRKKANSMLHRKKNSKNPFKTYDVLLWGEHALDWGRNVDLTVLKFKTTRYLVDEDVKRTDLERLSGLNRKRGCVSDVLTRPLLVGEGQFPVREPLLSGL